MHVETRVFEAWYRFVEDFARLLTQGVAEHKESRARFESEARVLFPSR